MFLNEKLVRPLTFLDFETTDKDSKVAKVVEFAFLKVMPDGSELRYQSLVNPGIPIPPESSEVHGITNDTVIDKPTFKELASRIYGFIEDSDLAGYNSNRYDIPILVRELNDAGILLDVSQIEVVDVRNIYTRKEARTLSAAYAFYTGKELDDAHSAMVDVVATKAILEEQFWKYKGDFPSTIEELALYSNFDTKLFDPTGTFYKDGDIVKFAFGKFKDKPIDTDRSYLVWMLNGTFPESVKQLIRGVLV
jgi:DNA polymerase-3 subunit epsilon